MPNYVYRCSNGHVFERRAGFNAKETSCSFCGSLAVRDEVYKDQGVIFKGGGWGGKSAIASPPESPSPPSSEGESPDVNFEKLDQFAQENYDHDRNVRPYVKEEADKERRRKRRRQRRSDLQAGSQG
ncbi:hypothetical protein LCGC14_0311010 [marine sediment metagenome]|uniref:Uncharacterized protein n=1 Tax=marine sediment metagenome TaxID=412755 RepID=A0A0F9WTX9_9ZZZZ